MTVDKVASLVAKPPHERGVIEVELSVAWLKNNCEVFREISRDAVRDVVKSCGYQRVERDDVILTQGDMGTCMFVMLSGRTSVYIANFTIDVDSPPIADSRDRMHPLADKKGKPLDRNVFGKYIISFDGCRRFGEMALMGEGSPRNATIIADRATDLLVIDKTLFDRALKSQEEQQYHSRKDFINKSALFGRWPPQLKRLLEMSLQKEVFTFNNRICTQGDPVKALFFVGSGQVKLQVDAAMHKHQYPHICKEIPERNDKDSSLDGNSLGSIQKHIRLRRKGGYTAAEQRHTDRTRDVCFLQNNAMFGDIEAVVPLCTYLYTAVSVTCTEVYVLENKHVERLISRRNQKTADRLKSIVFNKVAQRTQADTVPIMAPLVEIMKTSMPGLSDGSKCNPDEISFAKIKSRRKGNSGKSRETLRALSRTQSRADMHRQNSGKSSLQAPIPRSIRDLTGMDLYSFQGRATLNRTNSHPANHANKNAASPSRRPSTAPVPRRQTSEEGGGKGDNGLRATPTRNRVPYKTSLSQCDLPEMTERMECFRAKLDRLEKIRACSHGSETKVGASMGMELNSNCSAYGEDDWVKTVPDSKDLESKLTSFCHKMAPGRPFGHRSSRSYRLRSVEPEDLPRLPSRGGRVLVTIHPREDPQVTSETHSTDPRHVRRFVVSKQRDFAT